MTGAAGAPAGVSIFHRYLGSHSLLIGLLPFYLPVWFWSLGHSLAELSLLIGVSGLCFAAALVPWQYTARHWSLEGLFALTLLLEVALVAGLVFGSQLPGLAVWLGLLNGLYNAWFWTTQRVLFCARLSQADSGQRYGNFQVFVTVVLKVGILAGGWLLDHDAQHALFGLTVALALASWWWCRQGLRDNAVRADRKSSARTDFDPSHTLLPRSEPLGFRKALAFRDAHGSRAIFRIDGLFLFLESHFWTLSLFLIVREDFSRLGLAVVVLAVLCMAIFWLVKNRIDRLPQVRVYRLAVLAYALSWLVRALLNDQLPEQWLLVTLVLVTFLSTLFRLSFNKRFFDHALAAGSTDYLFSKSAASQLWLGAGFMLTAGALAVTGQQALISLAVVYTVAAPAALGYLVYATPPRPEAEA